MVSLQPTSLLEKISIHFKSGVAFLKKRDLLQAEKEFQKAVSYKLDILQLGLHEWKKTALLQARSFSKLGTLLQKRGMLNEAISSYLNALKLAPQETEIWVGFSQLIKTVQFEIYSEEIKSFLLQAFARKDINHQNFAKAAISVLKQGPQWRSFEDPLLIALLKNTIVADAEMERFLTETRRKYLDSAQKKQPSLFLEALHQQCLNNEYVYNETASETSVLAKLDKTSVLYGCYRPFETSKVVKKKIPFLEAVTDSTSQKVKNQYEENPYPRWISVDHNKPLKVREILQDALPLVPQKMIPPLPSPQILIAGCGTGREAVEASFTYKNGQVLAVDLSKNSLDYASKKSEELGIKNLTFLQTDLLDLPLLKRTFDLVECVGVLHHMKDPFKGWQTLTNLVNKPGLMNIGLYSSTGRQDILQAKKLIAKKGWKPTPDDIRSCRQYIFELPDDDLVKKVSRSLDFYSMSTCRDLLFHEYEIYFNLIQIKEMINELKLQFLGFQLRDNHLYHQYLQEFPDDPSGTNLDYWHLFEERHPDTFLGMYQFWVRHG